MKNSGRKNERGGSNPKSKSARDPKANKPSGRHTAKIAKGGKPTAKEGAKTPKKKSDTIRLNKYISNSGICSRREADMYIKTGLVTVNGEIVNEMGHQVKLEDDVRFDGRRINPEPKAYVLLNKPKGFATTTSAEKGHTVMDLIANATNSRIQPIGRLGRNSMGLLLFTNDDKVHQRFTNSKAGVAKLYHIELSKNLKIADRDRIREGFKIEGKEIQVEEISFVEGASKKEVGVKIKNTGSGILRTIFDHLGYELIRVDCVAFAGLTKKDLPRGRYRHLTQQEVNNLKML